MRPIDPVDAPGDVVTFGVDQPQHRPLPARVRGPEVHTRWRLTLRERVAVLLGRCIDIEVLKFDRALQPLSVSVQGIGPEEADDDTCQPDDLRRG